MTNPINELLDKLTNKPEKVEPPLTTNAPDLKEFESAKEEEVVESPAVEVTPEVENESDRSAYNCPDCKGEGITFDHPFPEGKICQTCSGTGKV